MIGRIIVSIGPGGYTALRIAATTTKVLAHAIGCELVAVETARVAAQAIKPDQLPALIVLASKNQQAHGSLAHHDGQIEALGVIDSNALDSNSIKSLVADTHLPSSFVERAGQLDIEILPVELDARHCALAAKGIEPIEPEQLAPLYVREPDAVTQWRTRSKKQP